MDFTILIPITAFVCFAYTIKSVVDAYARRRIIESHGSEELVHALLEGETTRRRQASLHWGVVLLALAIGLGLVQWIGADQITPGIVAILLATTGLGNVAYYLLERKSK